MAELTYRDAVAAGIAQEMERDERVVLLGEDIGAAGGVFKATVGLFERFGPRRVRDTPISEQAIVGAAMGAAMTGLRPIAEIMFSDFFGVCWDLIANEIAKTRYMTNGQIALPLVIRTANGAGSRFGAQHSQSVENWAMAVPGLKIVVPSSPADVKGLIAAAVRDPDPVIVFEHKSLYAVKGDVPDGELIDTLGTARTLRAGSDCTVVALALMVPRALEAAERLQREDGISCEVIDVRSLVPLDTRAILGSVARTSRLFTVEENPRLCGWGAEIASIVAMESAPLDATAGAGSRQASTATAIVSGPGETRVALNSIRRRSGAAMAQAWQCVPHVLQAVEADYSRIEAARRAKGAAWQSREGFELTYLPFLAWAVCQALLRYGQLNARIDGDSLVVSRRVQLGIAVDLDHDGLVVPVIRDAQDRTVPALAREIRRVALGARARKLRPDDFGQPTYTISNSGVFGTLITAPIVNPPQVAILSTDGVGKRPVVIESVEGDSIAIRPVGVLAQSFDHRAVDGAYSAAFLKELKRIVKTRPWIEDVS